MASSSRGTLGSTMRGDTGSSLICFIATATGGPPSKGTRPVSISYSTMPTA